MKIATVIGLLVAFFATMTFANWGDYVDDNIASVINVARALAAKDFKLEDLSIKEVYEFHKIMPRHIDSVTIYPGNCPAPTECVCPPSSATSEITSETSVLPPGTTEGFTSSIAITIHTTTTIPYPTGSSTATSETSVETSTVPVPAPPTSMIETSSAPATTVESSVPANTTPNTPASSEGSSTSIVETPLSSSIPSTSASSVTTTESETTSESTATETTATYTSVATPTTSTSSAFPPAPNYGARNAGLHIGLAGLIAVLALA